MWWWFNLMCLNLNILKVFSFFQKRQDQTQFLAECYWLNLRFFYHIVFSLILKFVLEDVWIHLGLVLSIRIKMRWKNNPKGSKRRWGSKLGEIPLSSLKCCYIMGLMHHRSWRKSLYYCPDWTSMPLIRGRLPLRKTETPDTVSTLTDLPSAVL